MKTLLMLMMALFLATTSCFAEEGDAPTKKEKKKKKEKGKKKEVTAESLNKMISKFETKIETAKTDGEDDKATKLTKKLDTLKKQLSDLAADGATEDTE